MTFVIPAGFGPTGVAVGDQVEAKGTPGATPGDQPTLVRLESSGDNSAGQDGARTTAARANGGSGDSGNDD